MQVYHLLTKKQWEKAKEMGFYVPDSLEKDGFIHCSTKKQVLPTAERRFQGRKDLLLLAINPKRVKAKIVFEDLKGMGEKHPHIYGKLSLDEIESVVEFKPNKILP
jgi:uncharacterized protein (DUF952 family)